MNLKSDLSWYGAKPGFARTVEDIATHKTSYTYNSDLTVKTYVTGFDNQGFAKVFTPRFSADRFAIDDTSHSFRGTSSRKTQQGGGSKFPIGPKGQVHDFDIPRLGFHIDNRYGNTYNAKSLSGLAATYTKNSPIDDVYNIVKVRDVSYDPFGYASPPYILRGIQRDDNRYPQRWGTGNQIADTVSLALGIPRGGALAFGERAANDVARLAKMLIRPMGLGWVAKQALLHLMNPNTEGVYGLIQRPNNHKFSNPINTLLAAGLSGLGIHPRKHGLLPVGGLGRYEDIINTRNTLEIFTPGPIGQFNRLRRLTNELYNHYQLPVLPYWNTITGITGPDTAGGIGVTQFSRNVQGNLDQLLRFPGAQSSGQFTNGIQNTINTLTPSQYLRIRRTDDSKYGNQEFATGIEGSRSPLMFTQYSAIPGTYGYGRDLLFDRKEFPVVRGIADPRVFFVTKGTRPDTSSTGWKIQIPTKVNVRTSGDVSPVLLSDATFTDLAENPKYFRSYRNPYNGKPGIGYRRVEGESQLEARYTFTQIPGIADSELTNGNGPLPQGSEDPRFAVKPINPKNAGLYIYNNPNVLSEDSNEVAMRSIYYPTVVGSSYGGLSHITSENMPLSLILDAYRRSGGNEEALINIRKLYRDAETPYGRVDENKFGYRNQYLRSQLEARYQTFPYDKSKPQISGIPDADLEKDDPNRNVGGQDLNDSAMRSIQINGNQYGLGYIEDKYQLTTNNDPGTNFVRTLYRDQSTPYGKNNQTGYSDAKAPGADNAGDSQLKSLQKGLQANGLNPGNEATIGKRLVNPKVNGITKGADSTGTALTGIRAYKTMTYPAIYKAAARSLSTTPTTFDFTTGKDWTAANSPMAKIGQIGSGDGHRKGTWDEEDASKHPINISIGGSVFPAYITDISTKTDQALLTFKPAGSPIAVLAGAQTFSTGVSISFMVAARSKAEYTSLWTRLSSIQGKVRPTVAAAVWSPKKCALTVGDFINITNSYLTSISLALDNEMPWDITSKKPMYINVDCQFEVINGTGVYA